MCMKRCPLCCTVFTASTIRSGSANPRTRTALRHRFKHFVPGEAHSIGGGFGSAVCEVIAEEGTNCRVHRIGMEDVYSTIVGTQQYLRGEYRMDDKAICERTLGWLNQ